MNVLPRVIPVLLVEDGQLYKTKKFSKPNYIGDPRIAVKIFNDKRVDELVVLDIGTAKSRGEPDFELIEELASECFMPLSYGGGVETEEQAAQLFKCGVEKIVLNTALVEKPELVRAISSRWGNQSLVASLDVRKGLWGGYQVFAHGGRKKIKKDLPTYLAELEKSGVGEVLVQSIDRDGEMNGYDQDLLKIVNDSVSLPVIACGGAGKFDDLEKAITQSKVSAAAAGSLFVYHGKHRAVLINYPDWKKVGSIGS